MKDILHYDIAVIGGGMAGMTAGVYAARANRSCIIRYYILFLVLVQ